jgi:predicted MFS family arabinose efflux permease
MADGDEAGRHRDGREALGVLALVFVFVLLSRGLAESWIVFLLPVEREFAATRQQTAGVYSTYMLVTGLSAPLAGLVLRRFGARFAYAFGMTVFAVATLVASRADALWQLYLCIGILCSLGLSTIGIVPATAIIGQWFTGRMSTAMGVVYAGLGSGALLLVPLAQWAIQHRGWRGTYLALSATAAVIAVVAACLPWRRIEKGRPRRHTAAPAASGRAEPTITLRQAVLRPEFAGLTATFVLTGFAMYGVTIQVVPMLVEAGEPQVKAAAAYGLAGMLSVCGVMGSGWLSDRFGLRPVALASFGCSLVGILFLLAHDVGNSDWLLAGFVIVFGIAQGARGPIVATRSNQLFRGPSAAAIYGVIYGCSMVGAALGAWTSGLLHDLTGSYRPGLLLSAVGIVLSALPFALQRSLSQPTAREARSGA